MTVRTSVYPFFYPFLAILIPMLVSSCLDINDLGTIDLVNSEAEYALPLVNSTLTLETVLNDQDLNAFVEYDETGLAVIKYEADVVEKKTSDIFKPIVFPGPLPFLDTLVIVPFDQLDNYNVKRGTIRGDSIRFGFTSPFDEMITVSVRIVEASKNGEPFIHAISIPPSSSAVSPMFSLKGYEFLSPENHISFSYDARKANGERVKLENGYFEFTYFVFDFVEGFVGKQTQKLYDHQIRVNVFELWKGGLLEFADPRIRVRLDNSFGFPVKAVINKFEVTNIEGQVIPLQSTIFDEDIYFEYPSIDEMGEVKSTELTFDKNNSNFATAFNQKVIEVSYDVDAVVNPDNNPENIGFFNFDSYYLLNVAVELPMRLRADGFQLADEFPIDSIPVDFGLVEQFELKSYITNLFPVDCFVQLYFMDEHEAILDSLFSEGEWQFKAANVSPDGTITPASVTEPFYITYGESRKNILRQTRKLAPRVRFSTGENGGDWININKNQGLDVKVGLKFKLK